MDADAPQEVHHTPQTSRVKKAKGKLPKLRASCDRCSNAKIRCDQSRPSCQRCLYIHVPCNYSASRRHGKPPSRRSRNEKEAKITKSVIKNSKAESCCSDTASESSESQRNDTEQVPNTGLGSYGQDFNFASLQSWHDASFLSDLANASNFANYPDIQLDALQLPQPQSSTNQLHANSLDQNEAEFTTPMQNDTDFHSDCIHKLSAGLPNLQQPSPDPLNFSSIPSNPSTNIAVHQNPSSCIELASSTLHSLSLPSGICASSSRVMPLHTVEQVLTTSRGAISAFNALLQCPCSHSSSFALTLALIISKILDCYSAICRCSIPSNNTEKRVPPSAGDLPTPSSGISALLPSLSPPLATPSNTFLGSQAPPKNIILDTPIAVGGYTVDPDDQHLFIQQLVLSELRKVGKLIDAFVGQYTFTAADNGSRPINASNEYINRRANPTLSVNPGMEGDNLYKSLERFLRYQVQKARRDVDTVLRGNR